MGYTGQWLGTIQILQARRIIDLLEVHHAEPLLQRMQFAFKDQRSGRSQQFWQEALHPKYDDLQALTRDRSARRRFRLESKGKTRGKCSRPSWFL